MRFKSMPILYDLIENQDNAFPDQSLYNELLDKNASKFYQELCRYKEWYPPITDCIIGIYDLKSIWDICKRNHTEKIEISPYLKNNDFTKEKIPDLNQDKILESLEKYKYSVSFGINLYFNDLSAYILMDNLKSLIRLTRWYNYLSCTDYLEDPRSIVNYFHALKRCYVEERIIDLEKLLVAKDIVKKIREIFGD